MPYPISRRKVRCGTVARVLAVVVLVTSSTFAQRGAVKPPVLDPHKIVNRSLGFLREREPEMSEVEYALYERMVPIVEAEPETALVLLETMLADDQPESAAFEFVLGNVYFRLKQMDGAERHYRSAVQQHPTFLRAWVNLGAVLYAANRYREAVSCFSRAVALGEREASTFGLLASSLRNAGNVFAAESAYKQAMTAEPENPDWIGGLLEIYLETEQHAPAAALARELVNNRPDEPRHWTLYAGLLVRLDRRVEAIAALQMASDLKLLQPDQFALLGDLCAEANLHQEAVEAYQRSGSGPGGSRAFAYVRLLVEQRRFEQAETVMRHLNRGSTPTERAEWLETRARLDEARGDLASARQRLEEAMQMEPLNGRILLALGRLLRADEPARAQLHLEHATRVAAFALAAHIELAQLHLQQRDVAAARRHARAALDLQPSEELESFVTRIEALAAHENDVVSSRTDAEARRGL